MSTTNSRWPATTRNSLTTQKIGPPSCLGGGPILLWTVIVGRTLGRLVASYQQVEPAQVNRIVQEEYSRFEGRPIRNFVPLFVERHGKDELSKLDAADPPRPETVA